MSGCDFFNWISQHDFIYIYFVLFILFRYVWACNPTPHPNLPICILYNTQDIAGRYDYRHYSKTTNIQSVPRPNNWFVWRTDPKVITVSIHWKLRSCAHIFDCEMALAPMCLMTWLCHYVILDSEMALALCDDLDSYQFPVSIPIR